MKTKNEERLQEAIDMLYQVAGGLLDERSYRVELQQKILSWLSRNDE